MGENQVSTPFARPRNVVRGILPTADATWGTAPTTLSAITDGDITTFTGTGTKTVSGYVGYIIFDLGSVKAVSWNAVMHLWTNNGTTINVQVNTSADGTNWTQSGQTIGTTSSSTEDVTASLNIDNAPQTVARYVRFGFKTTASCTANVKIAQIMGYEMGI